MIESSHLPSTRHRWTALLAAVLLGCSASNEHRGSSTEVEVPPVRLTASSKALASAAPASFVPKEFLMSTTEARVPIVFVSGMPVIEWTDSNGSEHRFLLDTGAFTVILSPAVAAAARLPTRDTGATAQDSSRGPRPIPVGRVGTLALGTARFEEFDAAVLDAQSGWDGLLEWSLFRDVLLTVDYEKN